LFQFHYKKDERLEDEELLEHHWNLFPYRRRSLLFSWRRPGLLCNAILCRIKDTSLALFEAGPRMVLYRIKIKKGMDRIVIGNSQKRNSYKLEVKKLRAMKL
jgi:hypothetical protein